MTSAPSEKKEPSTAKLSFFTAFGSTFVTIFLAEMGDKTQLATLLLTTQSSSPWTVFLGAALALIATSLLGVLIGYWLTKHIEPRILDISVALLMLLIASWLVLDIFEVPVFGIASIF